MCIVIYCHNRKAVRRMSSKTAVKVPARYLPSARGCLRGNRFRCPGCLASPSGFQGETLTLDHGAILQRQACQRIQGAAMAHVGASVQGFGAPNNCHGFAVSGTRHSSNV